MKISIYTFATVHTDTGFIGNRRNPVNIDAVRVFLIRGPGQHPLSLLCGILHKLLPLAGGISISHDDNDKILSVTAGLVKGVHRKSRFDLFFRLYHRRTRDQRKKDRQTDHHCC